MGQVLLQVTDGGGQAAQTVILVETLPVATRQQVQPPFLQQQELQVCKHFVLGTYDLLLFS